MWRWTSAGNLYVTDYENGVIRKITPEPTNWVVSTIVVSGTTGFSGPYGIAVDSATNLYVADNMEGDHS